MPGAGRNFDHVSINVDTEEELLDLQRRARESGVAASDVVDHGMTDSIYFEDPNGISMEFSFAKKDLEQEPSYGNPDPVPALRDGE